MKSLPENWLTDGLIDFEFKKYLLLDYLTKPGSFAAGVPELRVTTPSIIRPRLTGSDLRW